MSDGAVPKDARIAVTGANGFVGKNLVVRLAEVGFKNVVSVVRETSETDFAAALGSADVVFHLAGANRPEDPADFYALNRDLVSKVV